MGSIKIRIRIPTTGFVPGQSIETMVNFNNTSSVNVTKICVKLERVGITAYQIGFNRCINYNLFFKFLFIKSLEFHARTPYSTTKTDKAIVKVDQNMGPFSQQTDIVSRLQIPPISPSQLECCNIIDQKYSLRVTIHVSGTYVYISQKHSNKTKCSLIRACDYTYYK